MPAFTLYGFLGSTNTNRVRLTLAEGGFTDYEFVLVDLQKGEQKVSVPHYFLQTTWLILTCPKCIMLTLLDPVRRTHEASPMG